MQTIAYYRIAKEDMDSTGYEIGLMGMEGRGAPSVVLFEKYLFAASSLVLIFFKKVGFSFAKFGKVTDSVAPSVVLFEKHLFAASFLVLIFSKKIGFSLGKIKKVADSVQHSH